MQSLIFLTGALAIGLSQSGIAAFMPWACIIGLIGQPFWFVVTYRAKQWGMFYLSFVCTGAWALGVWTYWIKGAQA